jgi:hypothetical protein
MEVTLYVLFSIFCFLLFDLSYTIKRDEWMESVMLKMMAGFLFIVLAIMSLKIEYLFSNGLAMSYTTVVEDAITNDWQRGLFIVYALFGSIQMIYAAVDGMALKAEKNRLKEEED